MPPSSQKLGIFYLSSPEDTHTHTHIFFRDREEKGGRESGERNIHWLPLIHTPNRYGTRNLGANPDQESNLRLLGLQDVNLATPARASQKFLNLK